MPVYLCGRANSPRNAPESTPLLFVLFRKFSIAVEVVTITVSVFVDSPNIHIYNIETAVLSRLSETKTNAILAITSGIEILAHLCFTLTIIHRSCEERARVN